MKTDSNTQLNALAERLQTIDYDQLPISDYNKQYIGSLKPALRYFMRIYSDCLEKGLQATRLSPSEITLIDYEGGSGFLSICAKAIGIGHVIYIDLNKRSVETVLVLKEVLNIGPDEILHGDAETLCDWCHEKSVKPQLFIATDLIEHVYDLSAFFNDLFRINDRMHLLFTTASTPFNPYVQQRMHKRMIACENGTLETPNYYTLRTNYITKHFPHLSPDETKKWATQTRGLTYPDIRKAIETNNRPTPEDPFNTCDPATGNWVERILPLEIYEELLTPYQYKLKVEKGYYNTSRNNRLLSWVCEGINATIRSSGSFGFLWSPFIFLSCGKE